MSAHNRSLASGLSRPDLFQEAFGGDDDLAFDEIPDLFSGSGATFDPGGIPILAGPSSLPSRFGGVLTFLNDSLAGGPATNLFGAGGLSDRIVKGTLPTFGPGGAIPGSLAVNRLKLWLSLNQGKVAAGVAVVGAITAGLVWLARR